jgi:hypothetical protein
VKSADGHLEVAAVGEHAWRVSDARIPEDDAAHVVAFLEARGESVELVWLRGSRVGGGLFDSLQDALDAIGEVITTEEWRTAVIGGQPR